MRILFKKSKHTGKVIHFSFTKLHFSNKIIVFFYFLLNDGCSSTIISLLFHCCFTAVFQPTCPVPHRKNSTKPCKIMHPEQPKMCKIMQPEQPKMCKIMQPG